jgi:hypothetical protein
MSAPIDLLESRISSRCDEYHQLVFHIQKTDDFASHKAICKQLNIDANGAGGEGYLIMKKLEEDNRISIETHFEQRAIRSTVDHPIDDYHVRCR